MSLMDLFENITKCNYKPISNKYSSELSQAIKNMIVVDPTRRWSSEQVNNLAVKNLQNIKKPKLDLIITMDDIHIKLELLDYSVYFCKLLDKKPIHKFYFAIQDNNIEEDAQLFYFLELSYWIMGLSKPDKKKDKLALYTKTLIDWSSSENACRKFFSDIRSAGIKFEDI
eukprot:GHVR01159168.1.p1 GENE.GHVR01159168.1~~GHVR01159168.1.p1  ORF type:complete len:170 (+),score=12.61 GHVR01159168.1:324-833(+)